MSNRPLKPNEQVKSFNRQILSEVMPESALYELDELYRKARIIRVLRKNGFKKRYVDFLIKSII